MSGNVLTSETGCCHIPQVPSVYKPLGTYKDIKGVKCYTVGNESANSATICVYDIFGFHNSTEQGADILASKDHYVVMPDLLEKPWTGEHALTSKEGQEILKGFFSSESIAKTLNTVKVVAEYLKNQGASGLKVGAYGHCWGGKICLLAGKTKDLAAVALVHPSKLEEGDADGLQVPLAIFPSKDEDEGLIRKIYGAANPEFKDLNTLKIYDKMHHGFAAARANLEDKDNINDFVDVYNEIDKFFKKACGKEGEGSKL